ERLRTMDLYKPPGVAETIDWTEALVALGAKELDESIVRATIGSVLKYREDQQRASNASLAALVGGGSGG
ncbi:MAG TPA: MoxR family ATPase, partial [Rubrobacteraceae bacterium]|nr:MoxR family ATPase [Rubrobacteraceae bacterium]